MPPEPEGVRGGFAGPLTVNQSPHYHLHMIMFIIIIYSVVVVVGIMCVH